MINNWIKAYRENGYDGLVPKIKHNNPMAKYYNKKNLTKEEQLEYENMKLRIENEMLKIGSDVRKLLNGNGVINHREALNEFINDIVWDNNNYRPSYALKYKNPVEYRTQLGFK